MYAAVIGTSFFAMPWAITQSGMVLGPLMTILMGLMACYTAVQISKMNDKLTGNINIIDSKIINSQEQNTNAKLNPRM